MSLMALSPELQRVQAQARKLAADFLSRAAEHDRDRTAPMENYDALRQAGFFRMVIPREYGGLGHGLMGWAVAAEELAQGCASTALSFNMHVMVTGLVMLDPTVPQAAKERIADLVVNQGRLICGILSEPTASSHLGGSYFPTTEARRVAGGYRVYGRKAFATMWEASDYAYMGVHPEGEPNPARTMALLAPTKAQGVTVHDVWHTAGMRATRSQTVDLDGVFVPDEDVLFTMDDLIESFLMRNGAWSYGAYTNVYLGVGVGIINLAKKLQSFRVAKGYAQPMSYHPDIRRRIAEAATELDGARLMLRQAIWMHDNQGPSQESTLLFMKAKYLTGRAVTKAAQYASIACGVRSLFVDVGLERMIRDAMTATIQPPNEDFCMEVIGMAEMGLDPAEMLPPLRMATPPNKG